mgnify:CR=1 FL=1
MGLVSILDTMLTFTFMIPACLIAAAITYGLDFLAKQEAEEKRISLVAASPGMDLTLSELASYNGTTNGKPILVSILGKVYDVGQGAGLVEDVPTCEELVARVVREAEECLHAAAACAAPTRARL